MQRKNYKDEKKLQGLSTINDMEPAKDEYVRIKRSRLERILYKCLRYQFNILWERVHGKAKDLYWAAHELNFYDDGIEKTEDAKETWDGAEVLSFGQKPH